MPLVYLCQCVAGGAAGWQVTGAQPHRFITAWQSEHSRARRLEVTLWASSSTSCHLHFHSLRLGTALTRAPEGKTVFSHNKTLQRDARQTLGKFSYTINKKLSFKHWLMMKRNFYCFIKNQIDNKHASITICFRALIHRSPPHTVNVSEWFHSEDTIQ